MTPRNDLKGMKYGLLTVLYKVDRPSWAKNKSIYWFCKCDCGKELIISASRLRCGHNISCGCARYKNLTGMIFGNLTVIEEFGNDKNGKKLWKCKCICGNEKIAESSSLMGGHTKSCGCLKHKKQDLVGQKFGMLTVIERSRISKDRHIFWKCICECGNEKEVKGSSLKSGNIMSCGCLSKNMFLYRAEDLVGQRFERLVVLEIVKANKAGSHWLCQCDCGNKKVIAARNLKQGHTKSCGCLKRERVIATNRLKTSEAAFNGLLYEYRKNAKARGFEFLLGKDEFRTLTKQNCYYCGCPPNNIKKAQGNNGDYVYTGIDRVDNFKGYTTKNTVPCCKDCNWAKKDKSLREFKNWVKLIYKNFIKNKE